MPKKTKSKSSELNNRHSSTSAGKSDLEPTKQQYDLTLQELKSAQSRLERLKVLQGKSQRTLAEGQGNVEEFLPKLKSMIFRLDMFLRRNFK